MISLLWWLVVALVALWIVGFIVDVAGAIVHALLVIALIIAAFNVVTGLLRAR